MSEKSQIKLTEGSIYKSLMKLALPIMASSFLSTAYNITDMAWIGKLGSKAVAGVGVGGMYVWLSQGLASLARMGGQVYVAQSLGRNEKKEARHYSVASVKMVVIFGIVFGLISILFADALVAFFALDDEITEKYAKIYLMITCGLIVFSYFNYVMTGLYTAQGDSKTPLKANAAGLVANMILDPVLIFGVGPIKGIGVQGAAVATVLSQVIVTLLLIPGVIRTKNYDNILKGIKWLKKTDGIYYRNIAKLGIPTALQGSIYCAISMVLTRMVGAFGEAGIATQRVGGQIESVSWNTAEGFGAAMNAFAAQNYGAGKYERVKKGYNISALTMIIWGSLIAAVFMLFPTEISQIFFYEENVIEVSVWYLIIIGIGEPFMCVELMAVGAISGIGDTKTCSIITIIFTTLRIPMAMFLGNTSLGINGIWWALTISSVLKGIILHFAFKMKIKKR